MVMEHETTIRFLPFSSKVEEGLSRVRDARLIERVPNLWQIHLGVLRMWHRVLFRSGTIGTSTVHAVRATWRARWFEARPLRFPFLLAEGAIAPLDFSGLVSSPDRILRHLLAAHHDRNQFAYDLELLRAHPGWLERVRSAAEEIVEHDTPRSRFLRDLTVYESYHEDLLAAVTRALAGEETLNHVERQDPDVSFLAYLRWCARQPETPRETWEALLQGRYTVSEGVLTRQGEVS
jgi:hypothetical protein